MNTENQEKLFINISDLVGNMARLINSLDIILQKIETYEVFLAGYTKTIQRIEDKLDNVQRSVIPIEHIDEGVEDYGNH